MKLFLSFYSLSFLFTISLTPYDDFENSDDDKSAIEDPDREKLISDAKVKLEFPKLTHITRSYKTKEYKMPEAVTKQILELSDVSVDYFYLKGNLHYCYGSIMLQSVI